MVRVEETESIQGNKTKRAGRDGGEEMRIGMAEIGGGKVKEIPRLETLRGTQEWRKSGIAEERRTETETGTEKKTETGTERGKGMEEKMVKMKGTESKKGIGTGIKTRKKISPMPQHLLLLDRAGGNSPTPSAHLKGVFSNPQMTMTVLQVGYSYSYIYK